MSGPELIAPGLTADAAVDLEPGTYIIECYIKVVEQMIHSVLGVAALLEVTEASGPSAGTYSVRVNFEERETPGYRNVNLVQLDEKRGAIVLLIIFF